MSMHKKDLISLRIGQKQAQRSGNFWGSEEKTQIANLFYEGTGISEIALLLERTEPAVCHQLNEMKLMSGQCRSRSYKKKTSPLKCLCTACKLTSCQNCGKESFHVRTVR